MEFQPPANGSVPVSNGSARASSGGWPAVPPAPRPVKPPTLTVEPPLVAALGRVHPVGPASLSDDSPTMAFPAPPPAARVGSAMLASRLLARREPADDQIWQSRFAQITAAVIGGVLLPLTLPLWIVLFRLTGPAAGGDGPQVRGLVAICMLLLGVLLTGATAWMIIVEMRGRARMADALTRGRDTVSDQQPGLYSASFDPSQLGPAPDEMNQPVTAPLPTRPVGAAQPGLLRSFGQFPAQVAVLAIALALFLGAVVLNI